MAFVGVMAVIGGILLYKYRKDQEKFADIDKTEEVRETQNKMIRTRKYPYKIIDTMDPQDQIKLVPIEYQESSLGGLPKTIYMGLGGQKIISRGTPHKHLRDAFFLG
jgi:hypothetical protein